MGQDIELGIKIKIDGKDADGKLKIVTSDLEKITAATQKHGDESERSYSKTRQGLESISKQLSSARRLAEQFFAAQYSLRSLQALTNTADQYSLMTARLNLVTQSAYEFATAQTRINQIATAAQAPLRDVARLYTRLAESSREYAGGQENQLKVTEAVVNSLKASGASIAETSSTITQLSQVLSSGTAQWEDFGQLTDTNIKLVRVVLKGLGTDMGRLKKDMSEGKISSQQVFAAILQGYEHMKAEAAAMPKTVGGSVQEMANQFELYVGKVDQAQGVSKSLAGAISGLSGHMKEMVTVAGGLAAGMAGLFAASLVARIGNVANAIMGVRTAMLLLASHPLIAVATVGATYLGGKLLSEADLTKLDRLKQKLTELEAQTTHPGFAGPIKGRDEVKIAAIKAEIAAIESKAKAEDDARQAKAQADQDEESRIRKAKTDAESSKITTINSDIELLKARGQMREAYELEARAVNNLSAADQVRYVQNKLAIDAIHAQQKALGAGEKIGNKARQEAVQIEARYQALRDQARSSDQLFIDVVDEYTRAYNSRNISLQQYIMLLAQADDARDKSQQKANPTVPAVPHFYEGGGSQANYSAADQAINAELGRDAKASDSAYKSLEAYNERLDSAKAKTSDLGAVTSAVFDGALGGVNALAGAFDNMVNSINKNTDELKDLHEKMALNNQQEDSDFKTSNAAKYAAEELALNSKVTSAKLKGASQVAGFLSNALKKGSTEQRAAHALQMGLAGAELAMNFMKITGIGAVTAAETSSVASSVAASTAKGTAKAAEAVATQASAGPYIGFALMAAMAVAMAAIGFGVGGKGGKSVPVGLIPTAPDSGTVLGDPSAKSESINNTYELLKDIHAKEYRELRGINAGVAALQTGITDAVTRLFQAGGLKQPITMADPVSKWLAGFIVGGLFGKTKQRITGSGIYTDANSLAELLNGGQISGRQYTEITTTKKSWFSKKTTVSEMMSALDPAFQDSLTKIFQGMGSSMLAMATEFGADLSSRVNQYVIPALKISLHGMSSEAMIKTLNNVLSTQLDNMTSSIFGSLIEKYQKLGEGLFETATRLVAEKAVVLDAIDLVGSSFKGDAIEMADGLITLAGGIKEFQSLFQDYYSNFYTEAEQLANTTRRLMARLGDYDLVLPDSRQAYRDLVNAQKLDTAAGRERYNQLLNLAEAADIYYAANEKLRDSLKLLSEDTFATAVDYKRYLSLASLAGIKQATDLLPANPGNTFIPTGNPAQRFPGISVSPVATAMTTVAQSNDAVAEQIRQLRIEQQAHAVAIAQNTDDTAKILQRWNGDGLPAVRTIA